MTYQSTPKNLSTPLLSKIKRYGIMIFGLFILVYGVSRIVPILRGPVLSVNLTNGETVSSPLLSIIGSTKNAHQTQVNGTDITTSVDGTFTTDVVLGSGTNILTISAQDKFGKQTKQEYTVILSEVPNAPSLAKNTESVVTY
jgi:hypothetical protein